ncbi:MAG: TIGR02588 family protein [Stanieria sp.]
MSEQDRITSSQNQTTSINRARSLAEKVSFSISLAIFGFIISLIIYSWVTGDNNPPVVTVKVDGQTRQVENQYYVPFAVTNQGGKTADFVEVTAELKVSDQISETGMQQIDYLSSGEEQTGEFIFSYDPNHGKLNLRVASYKSP